MILQRDFFSKYSLFVTVNESKHLLLIITDSINFLVATTLFKFYYEVFSSSFCMMK